MSGAVTSIIYLIGIIFVAYYALTQTDLISAITGGRMTDFFGIGPKGGAGGGLSAGGATAVAGKMIYSGTGRVLAGSLAVKDANKSYSMASGNNRPSTRYIWGSGKGKGDAKCVNFNSYEATVYVTYGSGGSSNTRSILTGGGPGQRGNNCCVYSTGFVTSTGDAFAEEEGPHSPHPTIYKMNVQGGAIKNIGPLHNRTIGLKQVLIRNGAQVKLEGWVDPQANGQWKLFYRAINPKGGSLPVITKMPMAGENCGEVRFRTDGIWPVELDTARSFVAELPDNPRADTGANIQGAPLAAAKTGNKIPDTKKTSSKNKKKSNFAFVYDGNMHYLEQPQVSYLYNPY